MSLFHVPATCPHFTSLHHVIISHPCDMSSFSSLQHVPIWIHILATWFHFLPLQHVPILCPCYLSLFCSPATCSYPMTLEHVPISCPYNIVISHPCKISSLFLSPCNFSPFHVVATCHYSTSLRHFLILCPCNMSLFHILATWFHFISPAACPYFMSSLTTYLIPLEHVLISHPWDILISRHLAICPYFTSLWHVLILHPCNVSLFHILATGLHNFLCYFWSFQSSNCRQKELKLKCFLSFQIWIQISH